MERIGKINQASKHLPPQLVQWVQNQVGGEFKISSAADIDGDVLTALLHSRHDHLIPPEATGDQRVELAMDGFMVL